MLTSTSEVAIICPAKFSVLNSYICIYIYVCIHIIYILYYNRYIWYIQAFLKIGVPLFSIGSLFEKCQQIHCMITRFVSRKPPSYRSYPPFTSLEPMFPAIEPIWAVFKLLCCPFLTGWLMARFLYEWIVNMHPIYKKYHIHTHTYI